MIPLQPHAAHYVIPSYQKAWTYPQFDTESTYHQSLNLYMNQTEFQTSLKNINRAAALHPIFTAIVWFFFIAGNVGWILNVFSSNENLERIGVYLFIIFLIPYFPLRFLVARRCRSQLIHAVHEENMRHRAMFPHTACLWRLDIFQNCCWLNMSYAIVLEAPVLQPMHPHAQPPIAQGMPVSMNQYAETHQQQQEGAYGSQFQPHQQQFQQYAPMPMQMQQQQQHGGPVAIHMPPQQQQPSHFEGSPHDNTTFIPEQQQQQQTQPSVDQWQEVGTPEGIPSPPSQQQQQQQQSPASAPGGVQLEEINFQQQQQQQQQQQ